MPGNPFSLPGRVDPREPLDPRDGRDTDELYLDDMDNTGAAYRKFRDEFANPKDLQRRGRLVIATGPEGCGKTALINRCAWWARSELERVGLTAAVVDARGDVIESQPFEVRVQSVCRRLADRLRHWNLLQRSEEFQRYREIPEDVCSYLTDYLVPDTVVIVLLPPSEVKAELVRYAGLSREKLMFFAEVREREQLDAVAETLRLPGGRRATLLEVGPLAEAHGWLFVDNRMRRSGLRDSVPPLTEDTMRQMTGGRAISIGELQGLLYELYEEALASTPPPSEVTWDYIKQFYWLNARGNRYR
jgi:hypothetical protein